MKLHKGIERVGRILCKTDLKHIQRLATPSTMYTLKNLKSAYESFNKSLFRFIDWLIDWLMGFMANQPLRIIYTQNSYMNYILHYTIIMLQSIKCNWLKN